MPAASMRRILSGPTSVRRPLIMSSNLTHDAEYSSRSLGCRKCSSREMMRATDFLPFLFIIVCLRENLLEVSKEKTNAGLLQPTYPGLGDLVSFRLERLAANRLP